MEIQMKTLSLKEILVASAIVLAYGVADAAPSLASAEGYAAATGGDVCSVQKAAAMEENKKNKKRIPIIGMTQDCKYPVYDLKGELEDINYFSVGGTVVWKSGDLIDRIVFVKEQDLNKNGYTCSYVCKDRTGNIVGVSPTYKMLSRKK
jgi:hypothetical protein